MLIDSANFAKITLLRHGFFPVYFQGFYGLKVLFKIIKDLNTIDKK